MLGNLSDEETNELIYVLSENVRKNFLTRTAVESQLFPVSHYIHVACCILYDQSFQYKILKEVAKTLHPRDIAKRSKALGAYLNQLAFNSFAMLYLHGRAQIIHDNLKEKAKGNSNIVIEPEEKKKETKFIIDFWRHLSPNYRNDKSLNVDDGTIRVLSQDTIDTLRQEMVPVHDKPELIKKLKRTMAILTSRNFLAQAECRAGIFEQGPYETEINDEVLIFKEFLQLHAGEDPIGIEVPMIEHQKTKAKSPYQNVIFGIALKNMQKLEFNDWGTLFSEPSDFSQNITAIGVWTREFVHPKDLRYPNNLGIIKNLSFDVLTPLANYAQQALNEMYVEIAKWDSMKKLLVGVNVYTNPLLIYALHAGIGRKWDWTWINDVLSGEKRSDLVNADDVKRYIETIGKFHEGVHPFLARFFRSKKKRKADPSYYALQP